MAQRNLKARDPQKCLQGRQTSLISSVPGPEQVLAGWDSGGLRGAQRGGSSYTLTSDLQYHPNKKLDILYVSDSLLSLNMRSSSCLADSKTVPRDISGLREFTIYWSDLWLLSTLRAILTNNGY